MLRKKEISIILLLVICCWSIAWAETETRTVTTRDPKTGKTISKQVPIPPKQADPYANKSVLVEAFVVRVSTEALAEVGVNPIGQAPEGVSILKILSCLEDPEKAEVISGAKVTAEHNNRTETKNEETFYIKRESVNTAVTNQGPIESKSVTFDAYSSGKSFSVVPYIQPEGDIRLKASYSDTGIIKNEDQTIPPTQINYHWSGVLSLRSGTLAIAGATQDNETVTFLVLIATIQDSEKK
jgi:hypothetical protein